MTPFKFYFWFAIFTESVPLLPIIIGLKQWNRLPIHFKYFLIFPIADLFLNLVSDYYYFRHQNNLFLYYFRSLFEVVFILTAFYYGSTNKIVRVILLFLVVLNILLLIIDLFSVSKIGVNRFSGIYINLSIALCAGYYFVTNLKKQPNQAAEPFNDAFLLISMTVFVQFFVKFIRIFWLKYLVEAQTSAFWWLQLQNVYYYFMLLSFMTYTYVFYKLTARER